MLIVFYGVIDSQSKVRLAFLLPQEGHRFVPNAMDFKSPGSNGTSDTACVHEWIGSTSTLPDLKQEILDTSGVDGCLTARLYASCVKVLQRICSQISSPEVSLSRLKPRVLREELGRLYLCGEGLGNGKLDRALEDADELRENILEVLSGIGLLLARSEFCVLLYMLQFERIVTKIGLWLHRGSEPESRSG